MGAHQPTRPTSRLDAAVERAALLSRFGRLEATKLFRLARSGRPGAAVGSVAELLTGRNPYYAFRTRGSDRYRTLDVGGRTLIVDGEDTGISRTLLAYGVHEYRSTRAFARELERLERETTGPVTVLEIGANLGYFCTLEASILGDRARIRAIEPVPENVRLLERAAALNGYEDRIAIDRLAVGARTGSVEMELGSHSNQHRVRPDSVDEAVGGEGDAEEAVGGDVDEGADRNDATGGDDAGVLEVRQVTADRYLAERDVDPASVNVVRFDVEGYEAAVFEGLSSVLAAPGPTVLFVELHPLDLSARERRAIATALEDEGFELVSAVRTDAAVGVPDARRWHGIDLALETIDDLRAAMAESDHSIEVIARKPAANGA